VSNSHDNLCASRRHLLEKKSARSSVVKFGYCQIEVRISTLQRFLILDIEANQAKQLAMEKFV